MVKDALQPLFQGNFPDTDPLGRPLTLVVGVPRTQQNVPEDDSMLVSLSKTFFKTLGCWKRWEVIEGEVELQIP